MKRIELGFDAAYLVAIFAIGIHTLYRSAGRAGGLLFAAMALLLGAGDLFHLVPRMRALCGRRVTRQAIGLGNLITSLTATGYYLLLYGVWRVCYAMEPHFAWGWLLAGFAAARAVLCLLPQNDWFDEGAGLSWTLLRNIPFVAVGVVVIGLFLAGGRYQPIPALQPLPTAIALSFIFYLPAALFARRIPPLGALMMPKTLCYLWIQWMGLQLLAG